MEEDEKQNGEDDNGPSTSKRNDFKKKNKQGFFSSLKNIRNS
jgi:hypothetical protein